MKKEILYLVVLITKLIDLASCRDWPHLHRSSTSLIFPSKKPNLKICIFAEGYSGGSQGIKLNNIFSVFASVAL